jgi:hypothetical protein
MVPFPGCSPSKGKESKSEKTQDFQGIADKQNIVEIGIKTAL